MTELDIYHHMRDYTRIAGKRKVRDPENVAGQTAVRLWTFLKKGLDVTKGLENRVLNGYIIDALRDESRSVVMSDMPDATDSGTFVPPLAAPSVEDTMFATEFIAMIAHMPRREAMAWTLVNVNGLTHTEAAEYLGVTQQRVSFAAESARRRLAKELTA